MPSWPTRAAASSSPPPSGSPHRPRPRASIGAWCGPTEVPGWVKSWSHPYTICNALLPSSWGMPAVRPDNPATVKSAIAGSTSDLTRPRLFADSLTALLGNPPTSGNELTRRARMNIRRRVAPCVMTLALLVSALMTVGVGEAAVGDVLATVTIPAAANCATDGSDYGEVLAVVPGGKLGFPGTPTLVVTNCEKSVFVGGNEFPPPVSRRL